MHDDAFEIPPFLRLELTDDVKARIKRITSRSRDRKIKNPPKRITKRMRTGLGGFFGSKVVKT